MATLMRFDLAPHSFIFEAGGEYPAGRKDKINQVVDRSAGGKLHVETLGVKEKRRVIIFNLMSKNDYNGLLNWFLNVSNGAENSFSFTDEYGDTGTVKILDDEIDFNEVSFEAYSGQITLEYIL